MKENMKEDAGGRVAGKNWQAQDIGSRDRVIVRTGLIGIAVNVLLALLKAAVGLASHSIAVILDAVNNLSDALSSVITIVGVRLAGRMPDKKHPMGYGRVEYLSAMLVAGLILYAGITSMVESVKKMLTPEPANYQTVSLIVLAVAVAVKLALGRYVKAQGRRVNSGSLIASGSDAMFDAALSFSVLVSAVVLLTTGLALEAYVGAVLSAFIIKAGVEMMVDTLNQILGVRAERETTEEVKSILRQVPGVQGAYDLVLYNYGPDKNYASVHVELPDTMTVREVDRLTRIAEKEVFCRTGIILTAVGVYSYNTDNDEAARIENDVRARVLARDWAVQLHGFYLDLAQKTMRFDVVMDFSVMPEAGAAELLADMRAAYPDYMVEITPDVDV